MDGHIFLSGVGAALVAGLVGGLAANLAKLPPLVGYLAAGVVVGIYAPGFSASPEAVELVAELGAALLMFAVGVQFSLEELRSVWRTALFAGSAQILGMVAVGALVANFLGWTLFQGVFLGCGLALSSTAVMMKVLEERGELHSSHGKAMLALLIAQDLAVILMIALLPAFGPNYSPDDFGQVLIAIGKAALFLVGTIIVATKGMPRILHAVAHRRSRELFLLAIVCSCLIVSIVAQEAGLGVEIGAFMAGLMISESDYAHEAFSQVRPLRDVFASMFFVSVGMLLDLQSLVKQWPSVLATLGLILIVKALLVATVLLAAGWHGRTATISALGLAHIGEFTFVLTTFGASRGLISNEMGSVILSSALVSLLLAPFLYQISPQIYLRLIRWPAIARLFNRSPRGHDEREKLRTFHPQVAILGFGRVGRYLSEALASMGVAHVAVDYDETAFHHPHSDNVLVLYGDASSDIVLQRAGAHKVQLAIVALPDGDAAAMVVKRLKQMEPNLPIIARVHRGKDMAKIREAGAIAVIFGEFEAASEMIRESLVRLGFDPLQVMDFLVQKRREQYKHPREIDAL